MSPPAASPSSNRQLTQTPVLSCAVAPHFSHFAAGLVLLATEPRGPSESFIGVTWFRRRGLHTGSESRLPRRPDLLPCARLHPGAGTGNAAACCAVALSRQSRPVPELMKDWRT